MSRRIVVHDYVGHPFQVQLSRELARRGHEVLHLYSASIQTPRGRLQRTSDDPSSFTIESIRLTRTLAKEAFVRRRFQEVEYGKRLASAVRRFGPDVVMSANAPLDAQRALVSGRRSYRFVYWVQDLYGVAAHRILRAKLPGLGDLVGRHYVRLERRLIAESDHVVLISEDFAEELGRALPQDDRVSVIPNWAPLEEMPLTPKVNSWSRDLALDRGPVVLYAGTLGMKHDPRLLLSLAERLELDGRGTLVVVSEGSGADWLEREAHSRGLRAFRRLNFQPFERMPEVLGTADVLVAILEAEAGVFSVPSKVLTYLAAGRPVVAAVPGANLAGRILTQCGAGTVVSPDDSDALSAEVLALLVDDVRRRKMGECGRAYALREFDIGTIGDKFERILMDQVRDW